MGCKSSKSSSVKEGNGSGRLATGGDDDAHSVDSAGYVNDESRMTIEQRQRKRMTMDQAKTNSTAVAGANGYQQPSGSSGDDDEVGGGASGSGDPVDLTEQERMKRAVQQKLVASDRAAPEELDRIREREKRELGT
eukprot:EC796027.1.p2 GENE.EC796027.1~~EC796027.1.p2  ORF type:complete len:136 (+),score=45.35 EC796027.1:135-542(+)